MVAQGVVDTSWILNIVGGISIIELAQFVRLRAAFENVSINPSSPNPFYGDSATHPDTLCLQVVVPTIWKT
jgi:hypothetical protein